ncbi:MAG: hypothetical protein EXQ69_04755 [Acidimicrobiia bacterium]|nr:hypothetical protein [Acidimicrobiia bacterium]
MSLHTAREYVRAARALEDLPATTEAFAARQLSYSKVRAITRVATPKTEVDLVDLAIHATASHMDRIASGYCRAKHNAEPDRGSVIERCRGVWSQANDDGSLTLTVLGGAAANEVPELVDNPDRQRQRVGSKLSLR